MFAEVFVNFRACKCNIGWVRGALWRQTICASVVPPSVGNEDLALAGSRLNPPKNKKSHKIINIAAPYLNFKSLYRPHFGRITGGADYAHIIFQKNFCSDCFSLNVCLNVQRRHLDVFGSDIIIFTVFNIARQTAVKSLYLTDFMWKLAQTW